MDFDEQTSCAVCQEVFIDTSNDGKAKKDKEQAPNVVKTPCKHIFHEKCLWAWFKVRIEQNMRQLISDHSDDEEVFITCPMCNKAICPGD